MQRGLLGLLALAGWLSGCGYSAMAASVPQPGGWCVQGTTADRADAIAQASLEAGARAALARARALGVCSSARDRLVVQVQELRAEPDAPGVEGGQPRARSVRMVVVAVGWTEVASGPGRSLGEVQVEVLTAPASSGWLDAETEGQAREVGARSAGEALARRLLASSGAP